MAGIQRVNEAPAPRTTIACIADRPDPPPRRSRRIAVSVCGEDAAGRRRRPAATDRVLDRARALPKRATETLP